MLVYHCWCLEALGLSVTHINEYGTIFWFKDESRLLFHRIDGPAIEWTDGSKRWYLNDLNYTFDEFIAKTPIPEVEKTRLMLIYA